MAANGISTYNAGSTNAKQQRQIRKLEIAEAKRQGKTVTATGSGYTITGALNVTKSYYRVLCYSFIGRLPTRWHANGSLVNQGNAPDPPGPDTATLHPGRPWKTAP